MRNKSILPIITSLLALVVSACQVGVPAGTARLNEATFIATEYAYQGPERLAGGWTRLTLDNQGQLAHDLIVVKLGEGKTLDDVMAALEAEGPPDWAQFYGGVTVEPGASESYTVDLTPGNYVLLSFGQAEDAPPDAALGMVASLTVAGVETDIPDSALPKADAEISLVDFSFVVSDGIEAGEQTLKVTNAGTQLHELVVYRLKEGKTMADFQAMLDLAMAGEEPQGEPPFDEVGSAFISPGVVNYVTMDFEPGNHIFICHLPSPTHEMQPHFALGMVQEVTVP